MQMVYEQMCVFMIYFHELIFSLEGIRQEQDLYVRLIDSVTKQVSKLLMTIWFKANLRLLFHESWFENRNSNIIFELNSVLFQTCFVRF